MDHLSLNSISATGIDESSKLRMLSISIGVPSDDDHELLPISLNTTTSAPTTSMHDYKECMRNHAASIGGHATDGCGEFLPSGNEGTMEALKCAACDCHRNFHRRAEDPYASLSPSHAAPTKDQISTRGENHPKPTTAPNISLGLPSRIANQQGGQACVRFMAQALNSHRQKDELADNNQGAEIYSFPESPKRKRFRTKFSLEQKEKMLVFAEKLGWRMKRDDEGGVQQFCANVGVKRQVLKVWMHNNKHTLGSKPPFMSSPSGSPSSSHLAAMATDPAASHLQS